MAISEDAEVSTAGSVSLEVPPCLMERTLRLVALLRDAEEVRAPKSVPYEGKVVSFDHALAFMQRYHAFLRDLGPEVACPQVWPVRK